MVKRPDRADRPMPTTGVNDKAVESVLATVEPNRLQILFLLGQHGPMCVSDIARRFKITRPAISHHLKILRMYGVVETQREGREIYYSVSVTSCVRTLRALADSLEKCCGETSGR